MYIDDCEFSIECSDYAEKHFIKSFKKKYRGRQWDVTYDAILLILRRASQVFGTDRIDLLKYDNNCGIFKLDFAVAKTKVSPKASGNRVIFLLDNNTQTIVIAMIYSKTDIPNNNETQFVLKQVQEHFNDFWKKLTQSI